MSIESWLLDLFAARLPYAPGITQRRMFGYHCAFVEGRLFAGVGVRGLLLRLGTEDRAALLAEEGTQVFEPRPGVVMREYVNVDPVSLEEAQILGEWLQKAAVYAVAQPLQRKRSRA